MSVKLFTVDCIGGRSRVASFNLRRGRQENLESRASSEILQVAMTVGLALKLIPPADDSEFEKLPGIGPLDAVGCTGAAIRAWKKWIAAIPDHRTQCVDKHYKSTI
jgi:hypothetical protein